MRLLKNNLAMPLVFALALGIGLAIHLPPGHAQGTGGFSLSGETPHLNITSCEETLPVLRERLESEPELTAILWAQLYEIGQCVSILSGPPNSTIWPSY